ncbi:hypothetical protein [Lactiplantibacillus plantarum]|uniref:hypothetical protein n=1 Tax=Lactiplantibacillus plantarum TaxID=1590 RepID=UPI0030F3A8F4
MRLNTCKDLLDSYFKKYFVFVPIILMFIYVLLFQNNNILFLLGKVIYKVGDTFNTLTSIFAGIYFSLYILMLTLPAFSVVKNLNRSNYKCLILNITIGLLTSVSYSFTQIFLSFLSNNWILFCLNGIVAISFVLSLIQNVTFFGIIFSEDLRSSYTAGKENSLEKDIKYIKKWTQQQDLEKKANHNS